MKIYPKIFPSKYYISDIKDAYKWIWHPEANIIIISDDYGLNKFAYNDYVKSNNNYMKSLSFPIRNKKVPEFYDWIKLIHLKPYQFKIEKRARDVVCINKYYNKSVYPHIIDLLVKLDMTGIVLFDVLSEDILSITNNYNLEFPFQ